MTGNERNGNTQVPRGVGTGERTLTQRIKGIKGFFLFLLGLVGGIIGHQTIRNTQPGWSANGPVQASQVTSPPSQNQGLSTNEAFVTIDGENYVVNTTNQKVSITRATSQTVVAGGTTKTTQTVTKVEIGEPEKVEEDPDHTLLLAKITLVTTFAGLATGIIALLKELKKSAPPHVDPAVNVTASWSTLPVKAIPDSENVIIMSDSDTEDVVVKLQDVFRYGKVAGHIMISRIDFIDTKEMPVEDKTKQPPE